MEGLGLNEGGIVVPKISIKTNKPVAFDSVDHIHPLGTKNDNSMNPIFNAKLAQLIPYQQLRVLDLGCAGGGFVKSIIDKGGFAVGVEGSDYSKNLKRAEWATIPDYLFTADITVPFQLYELDETGQEKQMEFNVITAWEFMEHIATDKLPYVFENILKHLSFDGLVIVSVCEQQDGLNGIWYHQTLQNKDWWINFFAQNGLVLQEPLLNLFGDDWVRGGSREPNSKNLVLARR